MNKPKNKPNINAIKQPQLFLNSAPRSRQRSNEKKNKNTSGLKRQKNELNINSYLKLSVQSNFHSNKQKPQKQEHENISISQYYQKLKNNDKTSDDKSKRKATKMHLLQKEGVQYEILQAKSKQLKNPNDFLQQDQRTSMPQNDSTINISKVKSLEKFNFIDEDKKNVKYTYYRKNTKVSDQTIKITQKNKKNKYVIIESNKKKQKNITKPIEDDYRLVGARSVEKIHFKKDSKRLQICQKKLLNLKEKTESKVYESQRSIFLGEVSDKTDFNFESTKASPNSQLKEAQQHYLTVDLENVVFQMNQQIPLKLSETRLKASLTPELHVERVKCIAFISKICQQMFIRRQVQSVAIYFFDKYLSTIKKDIFRSEMNIIAITALYISLKIDDGYNARKFYFYYINNCSDHFHRRKENRPKSSNKDRQSKEKPTPSKDTGKMSRKSRGKNSLSMSQVTITKWKKVDLPPQSSQAILVINKQNEMLFNFGFNLTIRSTMYWIDTITLLWDYYIQSKIQQVSQLSFRYQCNKKNISYCYQILDYLYLDVNFYAFTYPIIILSIIYLIVRSRLEQKINFQSDEFIFRKYNLSLSGSTKMIFYDGVGINQLFGDFLQELQLNISDLMSCLQYIGKNIPPSLKVFKFSSKKKDSNCVVHDHKIAIYEANHQIFQKFLNAM